MQLPSLDEILSHLPGSEGQAISIRRFEHQEDIPWMSWRAHLSFCERSGAMLDLLAACLKHPHIGGPVHAPSAQSQRDLLYWDGSSLNAETLFDFRENLKAFIHMSPVSKQPIEQAWRIASAYGRLDEDTTTSTSHLLLLTRSHMLYVEIYEETLH